MTTTTIPWPKNGVKGGGRHDFHHPLYAPPEVTIGIGWHYCYDVGHCSETHRILLTHYEYDYYVCPDGSAYCVYRSWAFNTADQSDTYICTDMTTWLPGKWEPHSWGFNNGDAGWGGMGVGGTGEEGVVVARREFFEDPEPVPQTHQVRAALLISGEVHVRPAYTEVRSSPDGPAVCTRFPPSICGIFQ